VVIPFEAARAKSVKCSLSVMKSLQSWQQKMTAVVVLEFNAHFFGAEGVIHLEPDDLEFFVGVEGPTYFSVPVKQLALKQLSNGRSFYQKPFLQSHAIS